jgi:hypothetical protein
MVFNSINTFHSGTPIVFNNFHSSTGKEEWILMDVFIGTTLHGSSSLLLQTRFLNAPRPDREYPRLTNDASDQHQKTKRKKSLKIKAIFFSPLKISGTDKWINLDM